MERDGDMVLQPGSEPRIYVQIPSYRDPETWPTLLDLFRTANRPDLLRVRVLWQRDGEEGPPATLRDRDELEIIDVPAGESHGCNWARSLLQKSWGGEPYTLLLDSHHRFVPGWDDRLIALHQQVKAAGVPHPIISGYLPPYMPGVRPRSCHRQPLKLYPYRRVDALLSRLISHPIVGWQLLDFPVRANFLSLHFMFAEGDFNRVILFDPAHYFTGDEVSISLRAYTHGFELFHPHVLLGWHCYTRRLRRTHWEDHADWSDQERRSLERLRDLFSGENRGVFGIGSRKTICEYERDLMLDLIEDVREVRVGKYVA
jgi:hypothetical protein